jgi:GNAT superfamily N-acetyltransferase
MVVNVGELITRPYGDSDAPLLTAFMINMSRAAGADAGLTEDAVRSWFTSGVVRDAATDTRLVVSDGRLAAAALLSAPADEGLRVDAFGGVLPDWRGHGLGRELLRWQLGRAREMRAALAPDRPWELEADAYSTEDAAFRLFGRFGLSPTRYWYEMAASLDAPQPAPVPAELRIVPFSDSLAEALYAAHREAMADHYDFEPRSFDSWAELELRAGSFRADLTRIALDGDDIAAYVIAADEAGDRVRMEEIGTRRPWRRRGVASGLLSAVLTAAAAAGKKRASLGVDSQSPTGAVSIYERAGFRVVSSWISYRKPLA